ncbi:MAG: hypothetical protein FJ144_18230 [Deltaproteobacteria bacterium]|nr:hypothetical protein [Deltaproteobacteria bacterium]
MNSGCSLQCSPTGVTAVLAMVGLGLLASSAHAAVLTKSQQMCVTTMEKDLGKVDKQVVRQVATCLKNNAKGRPLVPQIPFIDDMDWCTEQDPLGKINLFETRTVADFNLRCLAPPTGQNPDGFPSFGVTTAMRVNQEANAIMPVLANDIWGADLDTGVLAKEATNPAGAKCQAKVWKAVTKCEQTRVKEFEKCTKTGVKGTNPQIDSSADLRDVCLGVGAAGQADPKKKIEKKCTNPTKGIQKFVEGSCGGQSLVNLFPRCNTNSPAGLANCLDDKAACRVCLAINRATGTTRDCELFDDGLANQSCACGNGILNAGEQCDDGNNDSGDGCTKSCLLEIG